MPAAPLAAVSLKDTRPRRPPRTLMMMVCADQRRNTDKAEKRERKAGAPKILKRVSSKGELPTKPQRRSPTQTDAEREQAYAAARAHLRRGGRRAGARVRRVARTGPRPL